MNLLIKRTTLLFCFAVLVALLGKPALAAEEAGCGYEGQPDCCSTEFLETYFGKDEAGNAAKICEKASAGSPLVSTVSSPNETNRKDCLKGGKEFGIGLFLINIYNTDIAPSALTTKDGRCVVANQDILNDIGGKLLDPVINAKTAAQLYKNNVEKGNCGWEWSSVAKELDTPCVKKSVPGGEGLASAGQTGGTGEKAEEKVKLGIAELIANFYKWALGVGGLIALGVLIFGGILYIISAGNASRQGEARQWLSGALIGILLLFGSYLILNTINPELTKLTDLELLVNKAAAPIEEIDDGSNFVAGPDCGGYYNLSTAEKGNFGDRDCEFAKNPEKFKNDLHILLKQKYPNDLCKADHWFFNVIPRETEKGQPYNPNSYRAHKEYPHTPDPKGAWGLFQMGSTGRANSTYDFGNVQWQTQTDNAVNLLRENGPGYWPYSWYHNPC